MTTHLQQSVVVCVLVAAEGQPAGPPRYRLQDRPGGWRVSRRLPTHRWNCLTLTQSPAMCEAVRLASGHPLLTPASLACGAPAERSVLRGLLAAARRQMVPRVLSAGPLALTAGRCSMSRQKSSALVPLGVAAPQPVLLWQRRQVFQTPPPPGFSFQ